MSTDETGDGNLVDGKDSEGVIPPATSNVIKLVPRDTGSTGPTSAEEMSSVLYRHSRASTGVRDPTSQPPPTTLSMQ
jgi:hypothetical protein